MVLIGLKIYILSETHGMPEGERKAENSRAWHIGKVSRHLVVWENFI